MTFSFPWPSKGFIDRCGAAQFGELEYHEVKKKLKRGVGETEAIASAARLMGQMRTAFPDAEIIGWEPLEGTFGLPDPDDEHVGAAAVIGGAGAIVTANLKDFPRERILRGIEVLVPSDFCLNTVSLDPSLALRAVGMMASRTGHHGPQESVDEILAILAERYQMNDAVQLMRQSQGSQPS